MKQKLQYEDLRKMEYLSYPACSCDGDFFVYVMAKAKENGDFSKHLYAIDLSQPDGKRQAFLLLEEEGDLPSFSPDGKKVAYLRRGMSENQIWIYDRETKSHKQLTTLRHGVEQFCWSGNSQMLVFTAPCYLEEKQLWLEEMSPGERDEWKSNREHTPVVIENLFYKLDDDYGIRNKSKRQIGIVSEIDGVCRMLTDGSVDYYTAVWNDTDSAVLFYGRPYQHIHELDAAIYQYDLEHSKLIQIPCEREIDDSNPLVFVNDSIIFSSFESEKGEVSLKLFSQNLNGQKEDRVKSLFPKEEICHGVDAFPVGRTAYGNETPAYQLSLDKKWIYFRSGFNGCEQIYRLSLEEIPYAELVLGDRMSVHSFCVPVGDKILYTRGDLMTPAELYLGDILTKEQTRLTYSNEWLNTYELAQPEEMWVRSYDNQADIHGFIIKPIGFEEGKKYPAVLDIHGGPTCFYAFDFWFEFQMLAAKGFAVVYCDPRGSFGYGAEFSAGKYSWGKESMDDLFAFLDSAVEKGWIDENALGVTGGSYGGHMTTRIIGTTHRFSAAVSQRPLVNLATSYGTGDMGFIWDGENTRTQMDNFMERIEKSPIRKIDQMKTPLLILQGEKDYRCAMEQAEQMFIAMKDRNPEIPVRLVIFPGENHGVTRHGKIHFQIAHLKEMAEWFVRFLIEEKSKTGKEAEE